MSKPPGLNSDQLNYLIWRYLQESGYGEAAVKLQRDWNRDPQSLPLSKHVKGRALIRLVQRGLEHYYLEQSVVHDVELDQIQPSMFYFGPESAQYRRPSSQIRDLRKERSPSVATPGGTIARKHNRDSVPNGVPTDVSGQPVTKKSRKTAPNGVDRNLDHVGNDGTGSMEVDRANGYRRTPSAAPGKSPTPAPSKGDMDVDTEQDENTGISAPSNENEGGTTGIVGASSLDAPADQDQEPSKMEDAAETPIIVTHTLTNGHSVEVQTIPAKVTELESETSILAVAGDEHVTRTMWRPKDSTALAVSGDEFCGVWKFEGENGPTSSTEPSYLSLLDKADTTVVSAMAWEPGGTMLAVATYNDLSGELRMYDGGAIVLIESLPAAQRMVTSLKWQNVGSKLVGSAFDGHESSLVLWDLHQTETGNAGIRSVTLAEQILEVNWASHGNGSIVCAAARGVVYQCQTAATFDVQHTWKSDPAADETWHFVKCSWWSEESSIAIAASADSATLWIPTRDVTRQNVHSAPITALELRPTSIIRPDQHPIHEFATASTDGTIKLWRFNDQTKDLSSLFKISITPTLDFPILATSFSPQGTYIAAASYDQVRIWDSNTGGAPVAKWDASSQPTLEWKGTEEKNKHQRSPNGSPLENGVTAMDVDGEVDEDLLHSISWDAEGKRVAFGLGKQVAILNFGR